MKRHKILAFLLALVVSVALWVYAVTFINPNDTISISDVRVRITGANSLTAEGLMLIDEGELYVDVEIAGRRSDLKELNSASVEAIADVSNISTPGPHEITWTLSTPPTVASGDIRLLSSNNRITVMIREKSKREVPVELRYDKSKLPEGYDIGKIDYQDYQFITVEGPANEVGKIARAVVDIDLQKQTSTINGALEYIFEAEDGTAVEVSSYVEVSADKIPLMMQILPYKDIALDINLIEGGGLLASDVSYTITPSTIRVTADSEETLAKLPDTLVSANPIDLSQIEGLEPDVLKHQFELPEGVTRWGDSNAATVVADVQIDMLDHIGILEIPLKDTVLHWNNGEQDMEYFYGDPDETIILRGNMEKLKQLKAKLERGELNIVITIDIAAMNQKQCELQISLPQSYGVGVFKQYSARIESRRVEKESELRSEA